MTLGDGVLMRANNQRGQHRPCDPLEPVLQVVVRCLTDMGAGNKNWSLRNSVSSSEALLRPEYHGDTKVEEGFSFYLYFLNFHLLLFAFP